MLLHIEGIPDQHQQGGAFRSHKGGLPGSDRFRIFPETVRYLCLTDAVDGFQRTQLRKQTVGCSGIPEIAGQKMNVGELGKGSGIPGVRFQRHSEPSGGLVILHQPGQRIRLREGLCPDKRGILTARGKSNQQQHQ